MSVPLTLTDEQIIGLFAQLEPQTQRLSSTALRRQQLATHRTPKTDSGGRRPGRGEVGLR